MTDYISAAQFRDAIKDTSALNPTLVQQSISSASRRVDEITGRSFGVITIAANRVFAAESAQRVRMDDVSSVTGLVVKTSTAADGTYDTTWTINTDFELTPLNQLSGGLPWVYTGIRAVGNKTFPCSNRRKAVVQVTALWGWPSVPDAVITATTLLAVRYYSRPDAPYGYQGFGEMGALPVRRDWDVEDLLSDYIKSDSRFLVA